MTRNIMLIILLLSSCKQYETSNPLIGKWVYQTSGMMGAREFTQTFVKVNELDENSLGIVFLEDNQVIENKNIGDCGMPPVIYDKCKGKWTQDGKKICIKASGIVEQINDCYEIITINEKTLILKCRK
jgi:hypothetical protein